MRLLVAVLVAASVARADETPEAPSLAVRADKTKVPLGEPFLVTLSVISPATMTVTLPANLPLGPSFGEVQRQEESSPLPGGLVRRSFRLTVVGFEVGRKTVPALPIVYVEGGRTGQVTTDAIPVEVLSVVGEGKEELKPIAPPVPVVMRDWRPLWIGAGALLGMGLVAGAWAWLRRLRRRRPRRAEGAAVVDRRPAHEIALERLRTLAGSGMLEAEDRRPFYFAVSEIVRDFLGRRYGFDALELTTAELLEKLDRGGGPPAVRVPVARWLEATDLVKYAGLAAARADAERALREAIEVVEARGLAPSEHG